MANKQKNLATNNPAKNNFSQQEIFGAAIPQEDALSLIQSSPEAWTLFQAFPKTEQQRILTFIQGNSGLPVVYDVFFHEIIRPSLYPERLESFLNAVLGEPVSIRNILPREGISLAEKGHIVIMDIIVELSTHAIVNIEIQKVGYNFPGERGCCYGSDCLMRQYNQVKSQKGKHFSYKDLKPVYLIVLIEKSPALFHDAAPTYFHRQVTTYDTGIAIPELVQKIYIALDIFHLVSHNITNKLEAWLTFFSSSEPEDMIQLVHAFPEFKQYYTDMVRFRKNPKELISMYSEALAMVDRNTERLMIEEMRQQLEANRVTLAKQELHIKDLTATIELMQALLLQHDIEIPQ